MSDYSFMRAGRGSPSEQLPDLDLLHKIVSLMRVLMEEAVKTAGRFAQACGREQVTGADTVLALKYEAREFFCKDIEPRFLEVLQEEQTHTYDSDSERSSESSDAAETEERESFTLAFAGGDASARAFHNKVLQIATSWHTWEPTDPMQFMLKAAVDRAERAGNPYFSES